MNKWTVKSLAAAVVGMLTFAGQAHAARTYQYVTDAGVNGSINLQPNQTQTVKLYLLETLTGGDSSLINTDQGLFSAGVRITRATGTSANLGTIRVNAVDFTGPTSTVGTPVDAGLQEAIGTDPAIVSGPVKGNTGGVAANANPNGVYLGNVDIVAGAALGQTVFNLRPYDPARNGNTFTFTNNYDFDVATSTTPAYLGTRNAASLTGEVLTVNVIPEPTFAGVAMVLGAAAMIRRRRQQA